MPLNRLPDTDYVVTYPERTKRRYLSRLLIALLALLSQTSAAAAGMLSERLLPAGGISLSAEARTVGKTVDHSPNLPDGGLAVPVKRGRFQAHKFGIDWQISDKLALHSGFSRLDFTSLRDQYTLNRIEFITRQRLNRRSTIEFGLTTNFARSLTKNSFTTIGDSTVRNLKIDNPRDYTLHSGFVFTIPLSATSALSLHSAAGFLQTTNSGTSGSISNGNCNYDFDFNNNGGRLTQTEPCGDIVSLTRNYPTDQAIESEYGISPGRDTAYTAKFYRVGVEYSVKKGRWHSSFALYHQQLNRGDLDQRLSSRRLESFRNNQTAIIEATRLTNSHWDFGATLQYQRRQFMGDVPVLYTGMTAQRFKDDVLMFSLKLNYSIH